MNIRPRTPFYTYGWIYDCLLEPFLGGIKKKVADCIIRYDLFPAIDICCGTGRQCSLASDNQKQTIGLDLDLKMMIYAASKYPHLSFICSDASHISFGESLFRGVIVSYSLHDKPEEMRLELMQEAKRILAPGGKLILVDFERPWDFKSRIGRLSTLFVERLAGQDHFRNGRQFVRQGGLKELLKKEHLTEIERYSFPLAATCVVVADPI